MKGMYAVYKNQKTGQMFCHRIVTDPYTKIEGRVEEVIDRKGTDWFENHFIPLQSSYTVILLENMKELCVSDILEVSESPITIPSPLYKISVYGLHSHSQSEVAACFDIYLKKWEDIEKLSERPTDYLFLHGDVQVCYNQDYFEKIGASSYLLKSIGRCEGVPRFNCFLNDARVLERYEEGCMNVVEFLEPIINKKEV